MSSLSKEELEKLAQAIPHMGRREREETLRLLDELEKRRTTSAAKTNLLQFAKNVYPNYSVGAHHRWMANIFKDVLDGKKRRVIINIAPRHGKSELTSYLLPSWWLGHKPESKIMMVTHTEDLSASFGRRIRNLIDTPEYSSVFPDTAIAKDAKGSGSWATTKGGTYYAAGVGGAIAGRGADLLIIDDPHSEQSIRANPKLTFDSAWQWYQTGPRQRLQWGGSIILVMTRWSRLDLTGKLVDWAARNPDGDQWEVVEFPAIMPSGSPLWPEKWPLEELEKIRATIDPRYWQSQYMQQPTADEGALVKRNWWRQWDKPSPPDCDYVLQSWDTAHEAKTSADYSAYTCWGVFNRENEDGQKVPNVILLDAFKDRMEFPELKKVALKHFKDRHPDTVLIERKASGAPLIQELRAMGVPATEFTPSRGRAGVSNDKTARLNSVSDMFSSGMVWAPDTVWAKEVIEEIASFPAGEHDDYCFVAGTRILMADGTSRRIERVCVGDWVATPSGAQRVEAAGCTGEAVVWRVETDKGALEGTAGHPVMRHGEWAPLASLDQGEYLESSNQWRTSWRSRLRARFVSSRLSSTGGRTTDIRTAPERLIDGISHALVGFFTGTFGFSTTAAFQTGMRSITGAGTRRTTASRTLSASLVGSTESCFTKAVTRTATALDSWSTCSAYDLSPLAGTAAKLGLSGIESMPQSQSEKRVLPSLFRRLSLWANCVSGVVSRCWRSLRRSGSADRDVSFRKAHTAEVKTVMCTHTTQLVFNLSVANEHCYYANGLLVHNCDSTVQALMRIRSGGLVRLPSDDEDTDYTPRRAAYY